MPRLLITHRRGEVFVTICDGELIGKEFREGKLRLKVNAGFYGGEESSVEECLRALKDATIANLVGSIVNHVIKAGLIDRSNVIRVKNIPHAQMVRL